MQDSVMIYDIESMTFGKPDPSKDVLKFFGCYSYKTDKFYMLTKKDEIQKIIDAHKILVGFNNNEYDNPILQREGIQFNYKIVIDLREIFKKRAVIIKIKEGILKDLLMEYSLKYIAKTLKIVTDDENKKEIDYKIFNKNVWTKEELKEIYDYTKRDIEVTKKMYDWVESYFESFKEFIHPKDVERKVYLTASPASFTYKAICHAMNWSNEMGKDIEPEADEDRISGGYVSYPAGEMFEGNLECLDFASLYPHVMIQGNLYGRQKFDDGRPTWNGGGVWKVEGKYYTDEMSGICKLFQKWFSDRMKYKKEGNHAQYTLKILLNSAYGISDSQPYTRTYDKIAAGDVTRLGRQFILFAKKKFKEAGYEIIYLDTDSCYLKDVYNDKEKLLKVKENIINEIKQTLPFPQDTFDMNLEDSMTHMFFFKSQNIKDNAEEMIDEEDIQNKSLGLLKKNYICITRDNKVIVKSLNVRKKSTSMLTREIFWQYLIPKIVSEKRVKFPRTYFKNLIMELLMKDLTLAAMRKDVGDYSQYDKLSPGGLQAQIAKKYGSGIWFMIPITKSNLGVGKGKSYCTIEEFKDNKLTINDIDLSNVWSELEYFIKPQVMKNIFEF